jgi:hypothetical protein
MLPGPASGLTQEEGSLSASSLLLFRGRNNSRDSPLGLNINRTAFLLHASLSEETIQKGCLRLASGLTEEKDSLSASCFFICRDSTEYKCCLWRVSGLTQKDGSHSAACLLISRDSNCCLTRLWAYKDRGQSFLLHASLSPETQNVV